jgi:hypothetical protein
VVADSRVSVDSSSLRRRTPWTFASPAAFEDRAGSDDVVHDDQCSGTRQPQCGEDVVGVARLVRIDEDEVEVIVEHAEGVSSGADDDVDGL